jgi:hypothetical protein
MAARRLLIVMLILLGLSTLAAALVPQRTLRQEATTGTTATRSVPTTPAVPVPDTVPPVAEIFVGGRKFPVVPVHVGDQFTLLVRSRHPREIAIPEFGLVAFATANTPARFELLPNTAGTFGVLFAASGKPAAQIQVAERSRTNAEKKNQKRRAAKPKEKGSRSPAPAESGPA